MISSIVRHLLKIKLVGLFVLISLSQQAFTQDNKPYNELSVKQINLKSYPEETHHYSTNIEVTIGDLHGNALKLMNFLIRNDVLKLSKEDYKLFVSIYQKTPTELSKRDLDIFNVILNSAELNKQHKLRFLGDDLCDRGMNDYYTLRLYKAMDIAGVPFEIVLSNHNHFFISAYEKPEQSFLESPDGRGDNLHLFQSMLNMGRIIEKGLINKQEVLDIIQNNYLKHLALPGYTLNQDKNEITLYTHAPIDLAILASLAKDLNVPYNETSLHELGKSLDGINNQIKQWIIGNTLNAHYKELNELHKTSNTLSPLTQILWNRNYSILNRDEKPHSKAYTINYVHGHDSMPNVFDLDNLLGKSLSLFKGPYAIHITHG
jgi:hypothetical protein